MRSLGMLQRQMEVRREPATAAATRSTISGVQSIGSSELMRNVTSAVEPIERAQQLDERGATAQVASERSKVHAGQRDLLESRGGDAPTSRTTSAIGRLRPAPRVDGMMQ